MPTTQSVSPMPSIQLIHFTEARTAHLKRVRGNPSIIKELNSFSPQLKYPQCLMDPKDTLKDVFLQFI